MRHRRKGKKLNRSLGHRKALYRNLVTSLVENDAIKTTLPKAKVVRPLAERLVTVAKRGDLTARRRLLAFVYGKKTVEKLLTDIAPKFKDRNGGYTRIVKLGPRPSDKAEMARLEFIPVVDKKKKSKKETKSKRGSKEAKRAS